MEYGIWSLHAAGGLWGDPRLARRHPILVPGGPAVGPANPGAAAFALNTLRHPIDGIAMPVAPGSPAYRAMELVARTASSGGDSLTTGPSAKVQNSTRDNETNIEEREERKKGDENSRQTPLPTVRTNNDETPEESDAGSVSSGNESRHSVNNNLHFKTPDAGLPCLLLDKEDGVPPVLNSWVLGAYTAMLGRLSAATAALEGSEIPNMTSDTGSDSEDSSYTEKSRGCSPTGGPRRGYSCGSCEIISPTRPALRKHIADSHPSIGGLEAGDSRRCPATGCDFATGSRCEMETHVAAHVAQGMSPTGKKRSLALQRVRYEREEYRCSMCSYACTIEKAFQRHLRAHAKGAAPETRVSCPVCGADRTSEVDLSRHMRRHRDDRYFCCDICIFRTVQLKKLIQHRRMHTGEKPHLCPHCAYRSARRDNLRSHVRRVHKKENLYCDTFSPRGMLQISGSTQPIRSPASSPASNAGSAN
ncbi:zinc finger and SCAN domain-containing protein 22-like isoform X2 [Athalia rosae]|uniref:zinc finger and SCAN domain-containing protein 22-like isoform X2 n=1 Tax=Athalia rosae TaxID=37344 RepID=UPI002033820A|nr:zinc finger and SCAN domain-containing protein 22-like isoform X2 [Athalia rosae]